MVNVTLRSGTKYTLLFNPAVVRDSFGPESSVLVGDLGDRLICMPYDCIKEISFVTSATEQTTKDRK